MSEHHLVLSEAEKESLKPALSDTRYASFGQVMQAWERFLEKVELGYELSIYDYTNDLSIRSILATVLDRVEGEPKKRITRWLEPLDHRFTRATFVSPRPPFPGALTRRPDHWWYARLPVKLLGELKESVEREGLLKPIS